MATLAGRNVLYQLKILHISRARETPIALGRSTTHKEHFSGHGIHQYHGCHQHIERHERAIVLSPDPEVHPADGWRSFHGSVQILGIPNATVAHLSLIKRASCANFRNYICNGRKYMDNMKAAVPRPPKFTYDKLKPNGWEVEDFDPYQPLAPTVRRLVDQLGLLWQRTKIEDCLVS